MSDLIRVALGAKPWLPFPGAVPIEVYHRYDGPLIGVVGQHGSEYLFRCVLGEIEPVSVWAYTAISHDERTKLESAESQGDFDRRSVQLMVSRPGVLAIATDDFGIVAIQDIEDWKTQLDGAMERLGRLLMEKLDLLREAMRMMRKAGPRDLLTSIPDRG